MKELIDRLVSQANLDHAQAEKVATVVRSFIADKVPGPLRGPVESALSGEHVDSVLAQAKGLLGNLMK